MGSPSGPSQQSTERGARQDNPCEGEQVTLCSVIIWEWGELKFWFCRLTFHTATACLKNIGVHFHSGLREQLVSCQVGVVRGGNEVVIQRLRHVLVHLIVLRVEDVTCRTPHEVGKTWRVWCYSRLCASMKVIYIVKWIIVSKLPVPSIPSTIRCRFSGHGSNLATISTRCSLARPRIWKVKQHQAFVVQATQYNTYGCFRSGRWPFFIYHKQPIRAKTVTLITKPNPAALQCNIIPAL